MSLILKEQKAGDVTLTPVMAQYVQIKNTYPECLVFFRMGDFYELFWDDAVVSAQALDIALTRRGKQEGKEIPMCGVPVHAYESYLAKLIRQGHRVAVCEQVDAPVEKKGGKTLMRREVVRVVTPGTVTEDTLLPPRESNFLMSLFPHQEDCFVSTLDLSTGAFFLEKVTQKLMGSLLMRYQPKEIILPDSATGYLGDEADGAVIYLSVHSFQEDNGRQDLMKALNVADLGGVGDFEAGDLCSIGGLLTYVAFTQKGKWPRMDFPQRSQTSHVLEIDSATRRNLELVRTLSGEREGSLLSLVDRTISAPGSRLLASWLDMPMSLKEPILMRQEAIQWFLEHGENRSHIQHALRHVSDIQRILGRMSLGRAGPRDFAGVRDSLQSAFNIYHNMPSQEAPELILNLCKNLIGHEGLIAYLAHSLGDQLPLLPRDGGFIRQGFSAELDEIRELRDQGQKKVAAMQSQYSQETGISSLKIRHNNILGYYVEVPAAQASKLTSNFIHRQTMAGAMRFTTVDLSELETKIISAAQDALKLELSLFETMQQEVMASTERLLKTSLSLATLDALCSLAELADLGDYCRPEIVEEPLFEIHQGRHPMVEKKNANFVPNNCSLSHPKTLWLMTGPNMAGKSTFLRQNALFIVLAQIGSFVPAKSAKIGLVDRLFSRVGASDDLARGRSTFMVEMIETAMILNHATAKSFVILDEVGRGTSTYDGMSIASAVIEHLGNQIGCRCLFATHYHEMTRLQGKVKGLTCYTMKIREWQKKVIFLHEVIPGQADRSYGIHVAAMAGLPQSVIRKAEKCLEEMEHQDKPALPLFDMASVPHESEVREISTQSPPHPIIERLGATDVESLSPRDALNVLFELKDLLEKES